MGEMWDVYGRWCASFTYVPGFMFALELDWTRWKIQIDEKRPDTDVAERRLIHVQASSVSYLSSLKTRINSHFISTSRFRFQNYQQQN